MEMLAIEKELSAPISRSRIVALAGEIDDPGYLLDLTFDPVPERAFRAAWLLEYFALSFPDRFIPIAAAFSARYSSQKNPSCRRHFSRIMMMITDPGFYSLSEEQTEQIIVTNFEWLIDPRTPVAALVNCLDVLFNLRDTRDWLVPELREQINFLLKDCGPAMLSRGKRILARLDKEAKQNPRKQNA